MLKVIIKHDKGTEKLVGDAVIAFVLKDIEKNGDPGVECTTYTIGDFSDFAIKSIIKSMDRAKKKLLRELDDLDSTEFSLDDLINTNNISEYLSNTND